MSDSIMAPESEPEPDERMDGEGEAMDPTPWLW